MVDVETARRRDAETAGLRDAGTERCWDTEAAGRGDGGTERCRDAEAAAWPAWGSGESSGGRGRPEALESTTSFFYDGVAAGREVRAGLSRRPAATRPLPMEDLCFFVKTIDNSRLVRVVDPHSRRECLGLIASVTAVFFLALLYIGPRLALLHTGYRLEDLKKENQALAQTNRQLQMKEATLRDPQRIYSIAVKMGLAAPAPEQVVFPESDGRIPNGRDLMAHNAANVTHNRSSDSNPRQR